jgi:hypothetical protein
MRRSTKLVMATLATGSIVAGCLALYPIVQNGLPMYVLSDEFEAQTYLGGLIQKHGNETDIPLAPVTVTHLADLIGNLSHGLLVQKAVTTGLSLLSIILGIVVLVLSRGKGTAQPASPPYSEPAARSPQG